MRTRRGRGRPKPFGDHERRYLAGLIRQYGARGAREASQIPVSQERLLKIAKEFD